MDTEEARTRREHRSDKPEVGGCDASPNLKGMQPVSFTAEEAIRTGSCLRWLKENSPDDYEAFWKDRKKGPEWLKDRVRQIVAEKLPKDATT